MLNRLRAQALWLCGLSVFFAGSAAAATAERAEKLSAADERFIREAAQGGMMEVQLGKMAAEKASSGAVRDFGSRMEKDHAKANQELKQIASKKGVELPPKLEGERDDLVKRLGKLSGREFDRAYMEAMAEDHKEDIESFQRQSEKGKDPAVKEFASKNLPVLKKHYELARQTQKKISGGETGKKTR